MTIGIIAVFGSALSSRQMARPSGPASPKVISRITRSGRAERVISSEASAVSASLTSQPWLVSVIRTSARSDAESSAMSTLIGRASVLRSTARRV